MKRGTGGNRFIPSDATRADLMRSINDQLGDLHEWANEVGRVFDIAEVSIYTKRIPSGLISVSVEADLVRCTGPGGPVGQQRKSIQAKDLDDHSFIRAVLASGGTSELAWAVWWGETGVLAKFPGIPEKVVYAKARAMGRRGLIDACVHSGKVQCRGDLWVTPAGYDFLEGTVTSG